MGIFQLSSGYPWRSVLLAASVGLVADECRVAASQPSPAAALQEMPIGSTDFEAPSAHVQPEYAYARGWIFRDNFTRNPRPLLDTQGRAYVVDGQMLSCPFPLAPFATGKGRKKAYQLSVDGCVPLTAPEWASNGGRLPVTVAVGPPVMITDGKPRPYMEGRDQGVIRFEKIYDCTMVPPLSVEDVGSANKRRMVAKAEQDFPGCVDREQARLERLEAERVRDENVRIENQAKAAEAQDASDYEKVREVGLAMLLLATVSFFSIARRTLPPLLREWRGEAPAGPGRKA